MVEIENICVCGVVCIYYVWFHFNETVVNS